MVFGRKNSVIAKVSDMIDGKPTLSGEFNFSGPHTLDRHHLEATGGGG
jgi:hypothetical protein